MHFLFLFFLVLASLKQQESSILLLLFAFLSASTRGWSCGRVEDLFSTFSASALEFSSSPSSAQHNSSLDTGNIYKLAKLCGNLIPVQPMSFAAAASWQSGIPLVRATSRLLVLTRPTIVTSFLVGKSREANIWWDINGAHYKVQLWSFHFSSLRLGSLPPSLLYRNINSFVLDLFLLWRGLTPWPCGRTGNWGGMGRNQSFRKCGNSFFFPAGVLHLSDSKCLGKIGC